MINLNLRDIDKASLIFNKLIVSGELVKIIKKMKPLDSRTTKIVTKELLADFILINPRAFRPVVKVYRPKWPWTSAYATTYTGNYLYIGLNTYKLNRSVASICGSIAHEWGHCFEFYYRKSLNRVAQFNHGDNTVDDRARKTSFQYQLGRAVKRYVQDNYDKLLCDTWLN